ncbi:MAG TPA: DUF488 domain-containing protein [Brevundimonas diminuta]|nr:DUF488 domain-containing protein [Brevundimonas diminuta]
MCRRRACLRFRTARRRLNCRAPLNRRRWLHPNRRAANAVKVALKRVYEPPSDADGTRILVDRLWPRGLSKDRARVDLWLKQIAPTTELRQWFGHDPAKWTEFQHRYRAELEANGDVVSELKAALADGPATLVYGARDEEHNDAVVLAAYLADL